MKAIVIGGGHQGLVLAALLGRAGLAVDVLERGPACGGMTATTEPLQPGYLHNPHANFLFRPRFARMLGDLDLAEHGLRLVVPDAQFGLPRADGGPPVVIHRPEMWQATRASLSRHSERDAKVFRQLRLSAAALEPEIERMMRSTPTPAAIDRFHRAIRKHFGAFGVGPSLGRGTAMQVIEGLFRSDAIKTALAAATQELGTRLTAAGSDVAFFGSTLSMFGNAALPVGGMGSVVHALERAARAAGATICRNTTVIAVHEKSGRVAGVQTAEHGAMAGDLVISTAGVAVSLGGFLEGTEAGNLETGVASDFARARAPEVQSSLFALAGLPRYRSATHDPDMDHCFRTMIGFDAVADVLAHEADIDAGLLPSPAGSVRINSIWDREQAPEDRHGAGVDSAFPDSREFKPAERESIAATYNSAFLDRWEDYAPGVRSTVRADYFPPFLSYERTLLMRGGNSPYATALKGYFLCGAGLYPGGGVNGAAAYNCFDAIVADMIVPPRHN